MKIVTAQQVYALRHNRGLIPPRENGRFVYESEHLALMVSLLNNAVNAMQEADKEIKRLASIQQEQG